MGHEPLSSSLSVAMFEASIDTPFCAGSVLGKEPPLIVMLSLSIVTFSL